MAHDAPGRAGQVAQLGNVTFRLESDAAAPPIRAGARWSQMAMQPVK